MLAVLFGVVLVACMLSPLLKPVIVQGLLLLLCALGPEEINEVRLGPLTPYSVRTLRHLKDFFAVTFSIKPEAESQTLFLKCIGTGHKNMSKRVT